MHNNFVSLRRSSSCISPKFNTKTKTIFSLIAKCAATNTILSTDTAQPEVRYVLEREEDEAICRSERYNLLKENTVHDTNKLSD